MKRFALVLSLCCVFGCATVGRKIDPAAVAEIRKGETTKAQVRSLMGSPDYMALDGDGNETWSYVYVRASVKGESFIPVAGAFMGGANTQMQQTIVLFGPDGVVKQLTSSVGSSESNSGLSAGGKPVIPEVEDDKRSK